MTKYAKSGNLNVMHKLVMLNETFNHTQLLRLWSKHQVFMIYVILLFSLRHQLQKQAKFRKIRTQFDMTIRLFYLISSRTSVAWIWLFWRLKRNLTLISGRNIPFNDVWSPLKSIAVVQEFKIVQNLKEKCPAILPK